ncbi:MAG TPA: UDP-N-acetylmuramate--L-alanine ligase, partial [Candidatus Methanoperedens sp.]|nr:UDP-N-acetylmuramate--L-alanine ligase [Candidatus Methanoperedens sp.]
RRQIPVVPRAEMLAELMRMKKSIAVGGAHGKTTTTSLVATILAATGLDPTAVIGGKLDAFGSNARLGAGELIILEADESDGSFLHLSPNWAVITNIDREHLDFYQDMDHVRKAFVDFANRVSWLEGAVIAGIDDPEVRGILPRIRKRIITYGLGTPADIRGDDPAFGGGNSSCTVYERGRELGRLHLPIPGAHNLSNALAAVALALELNIAPEMIFKSLATFRNAHRRFEIKGECADVLVVDDYAHHPTEIRATLAAAVRGWDRRVVVAFQPHRYTRSRDLEEEFLTSFDVAALVFVTEIYAAGEDPIQGVSGEWLAHRLHERGRPEVYYVRDKAELPAALAAAVRPGDLVLTLGAGDVWKAGDGLLALLGEK